VWLLFHRRAGAQVVKDGQVLTEHCPTCEKTTRFDEIETSESFGIWFVDVVGDKQRAFRCRACGDTFDLRDVPDEPDEEPAPQPKPKPRQIDRTEQLALEQRTRDAERAQRASKIEDELAALKKKLGK